MQLLPQRAFVVQFATDAQMQGDRMAGRVEHVVSNQALDFDSLETLLAFIDRMLRKVDETPPQGHTGGGGT